jgi:amino acid permease
MAADPVLSEKVGGDAKQSLPSSGYDIEAGESQPAELHRGLQGRHMQMIAIGRFDLIIVEV